MVNTSRLHQRTWGLPAAVLGMALLAGCAAPPPEAVFVDPDVERAAALFEQDRYADAIIACTEIHRRDPLTPGLPELQGRIMQRLAELRQRSVGVRQEPSDALALADLDRQGILPDTYRQRRHVVGETQPITSLPTEMQTVLQRPVSIHLENVALTAIVSEIARAENVNIVCDGELDGKEITIHVENTPLSEVLEYVGRNLGVTFAVGQNVIWVTPGSATAGSVPLVTRIYRLRKGLSKEEIEGGPESLGIIEAITRFVPEVEGADLLFNVKAHALIVKNTREHMRLIEDIIEVLDVRPPQVLIEARFISTGVTDLRELGVDWVLNSAIGIGNKAVLENGSVGQANRTQINIKPGASLLEFTDFPNQNQGLNFVYKGVLTDPAFEAVVHVLEATGKTRTLSVPRVTTVNNREASLRVGEDFRYFEEYETEEVRTGTTESGRDTYQSRLVPTGTPTLEELGIELVVTPSVGADLATIALSLKPEISEFVRWEYYATAADGATGTTDNNAATNSALSLIKLPVFRRSVIETEVQVRSGETVVMGGLVTSTRVKVQEGVPILSKLPFIGQLFRHDTYDDVSQNLLIFVTATLISDEGEELIPLTPSEPVTAGGKVELGEAAPPLSTPAAAEPSSVPAAAPEQAAEPTAVPATAPAPAAVPAAAEPVAEPAP
jgi:type II secretory pathway component GspD/PulD (secretin)